MKRRMKFPVTPDTGLQRKQPSLHCCPIYHSLTPQIFSAPEKLNNVHTGSGQNATHWVFFLHRCLQQTPRKSKNRARQDLLHPNTVSASYYFQLREFPEFDVVCLLVTLKGSLFQVFVQSPLELLFRFQRCSDSPWSERILPHFL